MNRLYFTFLLCISLCSPAFAIFCAWDLVRFSPWPTIFSFNIKEKDVLRNQLAQYFTDPEIVEEQVKLVTWVKSVKGMASVAQVKTRSGIRYVLYVTPPPSALNSFVKAFPEYYSLIFVRNFGPPLGGNEKPHSHFVLRTLNEVIDYYAELKIQSYFNFVRSRMEAEKDKIITDFTRRGLRPINNMVVDQMILAPKAEQQYVSDFHRLRLNSSHYAMGRSFKTVLETSDNIGLLKGITEGNFLTDGEGNRILKENCHTTSLSHALPWWIREPINGISPYATPRLVKVQKRIYGRYFDQEFFSREDQAHLSWPEKSVGMLLWWGGTGFEQIPDSLAADYTIHAYFLKTFVQPTLETEIGEVFPL
jgi:hypothetical protein